MGDARFERILGQLKALRLEFFTDSYERLGLIYNVYDYQLSNDSYKRLPLSRLGAASKNLRLLCYTGTVTGDSIPS